MGRRKSRSHQTISEHVRGSGAMIRMGSASMRHSHNDQRDAIKGANARRGEEVGREARMGIGEGEVGVILRICGFSVVSGSLTVMMSERRGR